MIAINIIATSGFTIKKFLTIVLIIAKFAVKAVRTGLRDYLLKKIYHVI